MRYCPICDECFAKFRAFGSKENRRSDANCVMCGSLERHRFMYWYLRYETNLLKMSSKKILHIAPRECISKCLRYNHNYVTADLKSSDVTYRMDIRDIDFKDGFFDVILCNHVLEHVIEDRKAMKEFYRVLSHRGYALLMVPTEGDTTKEDFTLNTKERTKEYGAGSHVRLYGSGDFADRLREVGFKVRIMDVFYYMNGMDVERMGLTNKQTGEIFVCKKGRRADD